MWGTAKRAAMRIARAIAQSRSGPAGPAPRLRLVVLGLAGVLIAGCVPAVTESRVPAPLSVADPGRRLVYPGLTFLPPRGANWVVVPTEGMNPAALIGFAKRRRETPPRTPEEADSVIAMVVVFALKDLDIPAARDAKVETAEDLRALLERETKVGRPMSPRHRLVDSKVAVDRTLGAECVSYDQTVEDTGVPQFPGAVFILSMRGVRCIHPYRPGHIVDVGYSQRYLRGRQPLALEAEMEPFVRSVMFVPLPPR